MAVPADRIQPSLWTILTPKWRSVLARLRQEQSGSGARLILVSLTGLAFWSAIFGVAYRVLSYIQRVPDLGELLAGKVLSGVLLAFLTILLLSNIITALSTFFLAKDLDLLVAAPVGGTRLYLAKLGETVVHSSWMVALLALPILTAYGMVFSGGPLFPFVALAAIVPYLILPAVLGTIVTVLLVNVFPARRTRELLGLLGLGALAAVVLFFRFMRPEQLARPEGFQNFVDYLVALRTPTSPLFPSEYRTRGRWRSSGPRRSWRSQPASWCTAGSSGWATRRRRRAPSGRCAAISGARWTMCFGSCRRPSVSSC